MTGRLAMFDTAMPDISGVITPGGDPSAASPPHDGMGAWLECVSASLGSDGLVLIALQEGHAIRELASFGLGPDRAAAKRALIAHAARSIRDVYEPEPCVAGLPAQAGHAGMCAVIPLPDVVLALCGLARPGEARSLQARTWQMLPMIQAYFAMWNRYRDASERCAGMRSGLESSPVATILLNERSEVLFRNTAAQEILEGGYGLRLRGRVLSGNSLSETMRLRAAVEHTCQPEGRDSAIAPVIAFEREDHRPVLVTLMPAEKSDWGEGPSLVVARVFDPEMKLDRLIEPACALYGLTATETKLACRLVEGETIAEAGGSIGVRPHTARSYLKQIFSKTATNRQAELVGLLLKSAVRTPARCRIQVY